MSLRYQELAVIEGIQRGQADIKAGHVTSHDAVMAGAKRLIEEARLERK